jgi:hypothetical protein
VRERLVVDDVDIGKDPAPVILADHGQSRFDDLREGKIEAQEQIRPLAGAETKNRTFMQQLPAQRSDLILPCRDTERLQRTFQILWRGSLCVRLATRRRQSLSRGYDYFFFFEVFFATFLAAAFAVFFAFFAFLAMSSSKNWLSEYAHAVYRHAQH